MALSNKTAILIAAFILLVVFLSLLFFQNQAHDVVESLRSDLDSVKIHYLEAYSHPDSIGIAQAESELTDIVQSLRYRTLVTAYSLGNPNAQVEPEMTKGVLPVIQNIEHVIKGMLKEQQESANTLLWLLVVLIIMITALVIWSEVQNQQKLVESDFQGKLNLELITALEHERALIAYDLHDSIAQKLGFIRQRIEDDHAHCLQHTIVLHLATEAIREIREIYQGLSQADISTGPLNQQLDTLFQQFKLVANIELENSVFGIDDLNLDPGTANHVYRIVQELLTNGHKHSKATSIKMHIFYIPRSLRIVYSDNGIGIKTPKATTQPVVLRSLDFRIKILKATMQRKSDANGGTFIQIEVPCENHIIG